LCLINVSLDYFQNAKRGKESDDDDSEDEKPSAKAQKVEKELVFEDELKKDEESKVPEPAQPQDEDVVFLEETKNKIDAGKTAAMEAEVGTNCIALISVPVKVL